MWTLALMYSSVGVVAGLLGGLLGVGGGLVIVPMLVYCFSLQGVTDERAMHLALGTSMASIVFTSISSTWAHHRRGGIDWVVVRRASVGILCGTFVGTCLVAQVPAQYLKTLFVVFLCYVATHMAIGRKRNPSPEGDPAAQQLSNDKQDNGRCEQPDAPIRTSTGRKAASRSLPGPLGMIGAGGVIGLVSSWVGIGGGTLSVPFLVWHNLPFKSAIGTSAALGFPIAVAGAIGYLYNGAGVPDRPNHSLGYVYLPALAGIAVASVAMAPVGAKIAHAISVDVLNRFFAVLLFAVAARMVFSLL